MQQRGGERAERDQAEQDEGAGRGEEAVERVGGVDGGERDRGAGRGQDRRNIGDRQCDDVGDAFLAPRPFAGREQRQREQAAAARCARAGRSARPRSNSAPGRSRRARASGRRSRPPSGCRGVPRSRHRPAAAAGGSRQRWRRALGLDGIAARRRLPRPRAFRRRAAGACVGLGKFGLGKWRNGRRRRHRRLRMPASHRGGRAARRHGLNALRATTRAATAMITDRRSKGKSNIDVSRPQARGWARQLQIQRRPRTRRPGAGRSCSTSRRKRNSAAGRPPVCVDITPVGSTSAPVLHQPAEILLVQMPARDRFHGVLQFRKCEFARQKFKDDRAVFQFGAQPRDGGGENPPVVEAHGDAERRQRAALQRRGPAVAARLLDQACLIQQLVAVEHALLVPMRALGAEIEPHAVLARQRARRLRRLALRGPFGQLGQDVAGDDLGRLLAPVFPGEEAVPRLEARARRPRAIDVGRARQREIADRGACARRCRRARCAGRDRRTCRAARHSRAASRSAPRPRRAGRSRRCGATTASKGPKGRPASLSPSLPEAVRISGSLSSMATIAAVRPISIGVRSLSLI